MGWSGAEERAETATRHRKRSENRKGKSSPLPSQPERVHYCNELNKRRGQEVDVRRELDSLVTQMHSSGIRYEDAVREFKRQYLREVLIAHRGNQCKAAEELGMHRNTLSRAMAELGLELSEVRAGLKRPPRSERPVYGALRQGYR
jgi:Fis family transcriptional regulator, factor for inversion stimulation protein